MSGGDSKNSRHGLLKALALATTLGQVALALFCIARALQAREWPLALSAYGTGALLALAAGAVGLVPGFLLGVPQSSVSAADGTAEGAAPAGTAFTYRPNIKVELIADWLIKIAVGVGLMQLGQLPNTLLRLGLWLGPAFGDSPSGSLVVIALSIAYVFIGFFVGFIVSYTDGPGLMTRALDELSRAAQSVNAAPFESQPGGKPPKLPAETDALAAKLRAVPLEQLSSDDQRLAWARAQASQGVYADATRAIAAIDGDSLSLTKGKAETLLRIEEGNMYAALYDPAPAGFGRAIAIGERLIQGGNTDPNIHGYLVCAYGQKHAYALARQDDAAATEARLNVLTHARQAVVDSVWKQVLTGLIRHPQGDDDDLASLSTDKDLNDLLAVDQAQMHS